MRLPLIVLSVYCLPLWSQVAVAADPEVNIVPWPQSLSMTGGDMALTGSSRVVYSDPSLSGLAEVVAQEVEEVARLQLTTAQGSPFAGDIHLKLTAEPSITGEAYKVTVATHATAEAANYNAVAVASVTLIQAIKDNGGSFSIPKMTIDDEPDAGYRGFMIDVARQQHSIKTLKEMVDICRFYKIRYMQIHFNDDQAYTLPSTAYPELNAASSYSYTLAEVTELVAYADARGVILIPEIEVPAHASAMINGNPELFGGGGGVINFASTEVWDALETIINEACDIFQSAPYIHLGADEANLNGLDQQQEYIDAIARHKVGDIHGLFNYFISHLDDDIKARGKTTVVWEGFHHWLAGNAKMDPDVHVMMFDNAKSPQAYIDAGHKVINASWNPLYIVGFDGQGWGMPADWIFQWDKSQFHGMLNYPKTWERTKFNPLVPSDDVIGAQMCSWEMWEWRQIPRLRFRIAPFADRIWNPDNAHDLAHFETRYHSTDALLDGILAEHRAPDAPINVGASDGFYEDRIRVGWGDIRHGGGGNFPRKYTLYRSTANNSATATAIAEGLPKTTSSYEDANVNAGQTYYYWVKARNKWGWSDFSAVASGKTGVQQAAKAYEPFDYPVGANIHDQSGGVGFSTAWEKIRDSGSITAIADSLTYPGLPSEAGALKVDHTINEAAELIRHLTENVGEDMTELWVSFLVKGDPVKSGWMTADLNNGSRFGKESVNGVGIHYATTLFMESNVTYFFVLYVDFRPGNDNMYLWVNPSTDRRPSLDDCDSIWETSDQPKGRMFRFNLSGTEFGKYTIDELRVGTTWEDAVGKSNLDSGAPAPNPMTWSTEPAAQGKTAATMVCSAASHADGVEYYFEEVTGNPGGDDSGWQSGTTYTDTGLQSGHTYRYRVKARNLSATANETHWSVPASMVPPNEAIGINMASDQGGSTMAGQTFDGCSNWTDAIGAAGTGFVVTGSGGAVTCDWEANNTWAFGPTGNPEEKLYHGYLDDPGAGCSITLTGLSGWLTTVGGGSYKLRVYANTDSGGHTFSDVELSSGGAVLDTVAYQAYDCSKGGTRAAADSVSLSADTITIDPKANGEGQRATIAGVQVISVAGDNPPPAPDPVTPPDATGVMPSAMGLNTTATVGGIVWVDANRNGIQDKDDRAQEGIGLKLYFDKNGDGFPERLIERTVSNSKGRYAFTGVKPGLYSVGLEVRSLPDEIYEATRLHVGAGNRDNDLDRNTLRTRSFEVKAGDGVLDDVADLGLVVGSSEVEYLGEEDYVSLTGLQVKCDVYLYKGLKLRFPSHHGRLKPEVIKQWMQWLKLTDSIQQQLFVSEAFLDGGMTREMGRGNLDDTVGHRPLAYAGGTYASAPRSEGDDVGKVLLEDPDDFHRHWTLIYEMGRVHPGPWHFRATWPPYTFMNAHFQTAVVLHELGGEEALKVPNPYNGLAYQTNLTGLDFWERSGYKFAETFQPDFADRGVELFIDDERNFLWGGTINIMILFHIYREDGFEKMVEVLQNMTRKERLVSTAAQAGLDFSEAVNDATDGKYARKLIEDWGMPDPANYVFRTLGRDTGAFVDKDEYRWDFIPFNSEEVAAGYAPLTEKSTKGYVRWTCSPGWATRSRDGQLGQATERDQTIVGMGHDNAGIEGGTPIPEGAFTLRHELRPAVWEVKVGFSNIVETHGVCIATEGTRKKEGVTLPRHAYHEETLEVEVRDGALDLSFWNESSAFNSIGISSLRVKRLRGLSR